jgi:hypothetical protein
MKIHAAWLLPAAIIGVLAHSYTSGQMFASSEREGMLRDYDAYRECIPQPNCMTAEDYIDYYNLKWRIESG